MCFFHFLDFVHSFSFFVAVVVKIVNSSPIRSPFLFWHKSIWCVNRKCIYTISIWRSVYVSGAGVERRRLQENAQENVYRITEWNGALIIQSSRKTGYHCRRSTIVHLKIEDAYQCIQLHNKMHSMSENELELCVHFAYLICHRLTLKRRARQQMVMHASSASNCECDGSLRRLAVVQTLIARPLRCCLCASTFFFVRFIRLIVFVLLSSNRFRCDRRR